MVSKFRLGGLCDRWAIAGSVRRKKPEVSDIEIVYVPRVERKEIPGQLFPHSRSVNLVDEEISKLVAAGPLCLRLVKMAAPLGLEPGTNSWFTSPAESPWTFSPARSKTGGTSSPAAPVVQTRTREFQMPPLREASTGAQGDLGLKTCATAESSRSILRRKFSPSSGCPAFPQKIGSSRFTARHRQRRGSQCGERGRLKNIFWRLFFRTPHLIPHPSCPLQCASPCWFYFRHASPWQMRLSRRNRDGLTGSS